jgi:hypothetical protein
LRVGEELSADQQDGPVPFAPRCTKDLIEERLPAQQRDRFPRLDLVFMDTTGLHRIGTLPPRLRAARWRDGNAACE